MPAMSKLRVVLRQTTSNQNNAYFNDAPAVDAEADHVLRMPIPTWVDMGQPTEITVTVRPGDQLNK